MAFFQFGESCPSSIYDSDNGVKSTNVEPVWMIYTADIQGIQNSPCFGRLNNESPCGYKNGIGAPNQSSTGAA
jgi:hypothetical protein